MTIIMQDINVIATITAISLLVQGVSVILALKLIKITGYRIAWICISTAIVLMVIRRSIAFYQILSGAAIHPGDLLFEIIGLATSVAILLGIVFIAPIFRAMANNIEELHEAHEKIKTEEKMLNDITSSVAEGIYVFNAEGKITFMNPAAKALVGWNAEELNRELPHNLIHNIRPDGSHLPLSECHMHGVMKTGEVYYSKNEIFTKKDGTALPISVLSSPIIEKGEVVASVTVFRDISVEKKLEVERENLISELQEALATINTLQGILPICSFCKKIRDDKGYWNQLEEYISSHSAALFSHSICAECATKHYPTIFKDGVI